MKSCFRGESGGAQDDRSQEEGGGTVQRTVEDQRTGNSHFWLVDAMLIWLDESLLY